MNLRTFFLGLTILLLTTEFVNGQSVTYVGIPRENFNYFAASQRNSNWCWAASIQMIFNYYGIVINQEQIVQRTYGTDPFGNLPNWTGSFDVITANLNNWNIDNQGRQYSVMASLNWGAPNPSVLVNELAAKRPVMIGFRTGPNSAHAVVITACSYVGTPQAPFIQSIVVRDPWPSDANIMNYGRVEHPAANLANLIQSHWYIVVR